MLVYNLAKVHRRAIQHFASSKQLQFEYLYGINPVECALHARRRTFESLYLSDSDHIELSSRAARLILHAKESNIPIIFTHKDKLGRMVKQQPHQNIILKCSPLQLESASKKHFKKGIYVFCDKITDPQNMGAILRSCLFFGVETVFTGKKNHCPVNSTVSKASAGAAELISTLLIQNSSEFLSNWKEEGGIVVATSVNQSKPHTPAKELSNVLRQQKIEKVLLVIGSQANGVSPHIISASDYCVSIQRSGQTNHPFNLVVGSLMSFDTPIQIFVNILLILLTGYY